MSFETLFGKMDRMGTISFMPIWFLFFFTSYTIKKIRYIPARVIKLCVSVLWKRKIL